MKEKELQEKIDKAMENIPKIQTNNSISSMNSINVDELRKTAEIFKRILTFDDLQKENNKLLKEKQELKEQLELSEKARKEAIDKLKTLGKFDGEKCIRSFKLWTADFNELISILDIDKGDEQ